MSVPKVRGAVQEARSGYHTPLDVVVCSAAEGTGVEQLHLAVQQMLTAVRLAQEAADEWEREALAELEANEGLQW